MENEIKGVNKTKAQLLALEQTEASLKFTKQQNELKIKLCIDWFLNIEYQHLILNNNAEATTNNNSNKTAIVSLLMSPLEKRFKFHFTGDKKTNDLKKVLILFLKSAFKIINFNEFILKKYSQNGICLKY